MTFQIFVGGQRVNSSDVLNQAAWSGKDKSRKRDCGKDEDAVAYVTSRKRTIGEGGHQVLSQVTNYVQAGK